MKNKKIGIILVYVIIVILAILLFSYKFELLESGYAKYNTLKQENTGNIIEEVNDGDVFTQRLDVSENRLKYIDIYFNTSDVTSTDGIYILKIIDEDGNVVQSQDIAYVQTSLNSKYRLKVDELSMVKDYTLNLQYNGEKSEFYPLINEEIEDRIFFVNGKEYSGALQTESFYINLSEYILFYLGLAIIIIVLSAIGYFVLKRKETIEKKFLYLAIPIFILYMVLIPLYVGHDELFHWYRIFEITEGGLLPDIQNNSTGYYMPDAIISSLPWGDLKYIDIIKEIIDKIDYSNLSFISDVTMSVYSPVQYLPQVIGVGIGKILTDRPILISYLGRLANLAICITMLYYAIKKIPFAKKLLLILAFIPIAIEGFVTLSGDGFTIATAFLFIAYILDIYNQKRKLTKKDYAILSILGVIIAFCKIVYIPIVFLLLLLPKESFENNNKKRYLVIISMIVVFVLLNLTWLMLANPYLDVYTNGESDYQIEFVLTNIVKYCQMFLYTIQENGIGYIEELFGKSLLWGSAVKNKTFVPLILITLSILACINDEKMKNRFKVREIIIFIFVVLAVIALVFTSLFVQWTSYGSDKIDGVQGRYFLPIIPIAFILIGNFIGRKSKEDSEIFEKIALIGCIFVSFMSLMELFVKYI